MCAGTAIAGVGNVSGGLGYEDKISGWIVGIAVAFANKNQESRSGTFR